MKIRHAALILSWAVVSACSLLRGGSSSLEPPPAQPSVGAAAQALVRPGDRVALKIWNEEEMSDTFAVAESGVVTLPKVGAIDVTRQTIASLEDSLRAAYAVYLNNPSVEIAVLRRVGVIGEVREPGLYLADLTMTLPDIIARAGGITEAGNLNDITIFRGAEQVHFGAGDRSRLAMTDLQSGDQVVVGQRSFIARNPLVAISSALGIASFFISQVIPALK